MVVVEVLIDTAHIIYKNTIDVYSDGFFVDTAMRWSGYITKTVAFSFVTCPCCAIWRIVLIAKSLKSNGNGFKLRTHTKPHTTLNSQTFVFIVCCSERSGVRASSFANVRTTIALIIERRARRPRGQSSVGVVCDLTPSALVIDGPNK